MKSISEIVLQRKAVANFRRRSKLRIKKRVASRNADFRTKLWRLQGWKCAGLVIRGVYVPCSHEIRPFKSECDHIIELRYLGQDDFHNLQLLCRPCHLEKTRLNRLSERAH